jgi:Ca-activated chloride channel family protein
METGDSGMTWHNPWMLCLLALLLPVWWRWLAQGRRFAVQFSSVAWLKQQGPSVRARTRHILPILRTLAVGLLVLCLTRPQRPHKETKVVSEGIAIQMLVDRSSSMRAMDFLIDGRPADRLAAVKKVFREFVLGGEGLDGRPDDLIGMIAFAGYADSRCPLTLDHAFLIETLDQTEIVSLDEAREEDGTAIGDAIALAVERLADLDRRREAAAVNKIKSRLIILLTDGENTAGDLSPEKGAELAATCGIKIHTIGKGTTGVAPMPVRDPSGKVSLQPTRVTIDEATLKRIAEITGGLYWRATDTDSMRRICTEIDELEKTKIEEKRYYQYAEFATDTMHIGGLTVPPVLPVVVALLALEVVLVNTRLRKVP